VDWVNALLEGSHIEALVDVGVDITITINLVLEEVVAL